MVDCPICGQKVAEASINAHIDSGCESFLAISDAPPPSSQNVGSQKSSDVASIFQKQSKSHAQSPRSQETLPAKETPLASVSKLGMSENKRPLANDEAMNEAVISKDVYPHVKRTKVNPFEKTAPLAERMRPQSLDEVCGQELVGPEGVLRTLIEQDRVPSMILWGNPGTGKTTIARLIAQTAGTRFVEINSTSSGVAECKKLFAEARNEMSLTARKTIIFCDEIHRFSKSQQDVFLAPVEAGHIILIGATTENPSFKVINALLSRCRTFTLAKLGTSDLITILQRALTSEQQTLSLPASPLLDLPFLAFLAAFSDGDARTALNLLSLAIDLSTRPNMTPQSLKSSLTKTLVYDRAGDQHYDTISAFHKSVRGSDPDATLYYLARMLASGEDPLFIARRMVVIASEDVGLADNTLLPLATAAYTAAEKVGLPEARINLAHAAVALALAPKSVRAYRGLGKAMKAVAEPGIAGLPVPIHLRNAPTRLMKEMGYGAEYKYNPDYIEGRVKQDYLPEELSGKHFLEDNDLGDEVDVELT